MSDLKAPGREGGFQSLRRTLDRPIWLRWINWYKHSPAPPSYGSVLVVPKRCQMPRWGTENGCRGGNRKNAEVVHSGLTDFCMEMTTGFYIGWRSYLGTSLAHYLLFNGLIYSYYIPTQHIRPPPTGCTTTVKKITWVTWMHYMDAVMRGDGMMSAWML